MAKFLKKVTLKREGLEEDCKQLIEKYLKPYLQKNDMVTVRKILSVGESPLSYADEKAMEADSWSYDVYQVFPIVTDFLLQNLGEEIYFKGADKIFQEEFFEDKYLSFIELPNTIHIISESAFEDSQLQKIIIPDTVRVIGENAFRHSRLNGKITIPEGVESIGEGAFSETNLVEVTLPKSIKAIEVGVFSNCYNLKKIICPEELEYLPEKLGYSTTSIGSFLVNDYATDVEVELY